MPVPDIEIFRNLNKSQKDKYREEVLVECATGLKNERELLEGIKSRGYLSDWSENQVVIDVKVDRRKEDTKIWDLDQIMLRCGGPLSIFEGLLPITHFPHLTLLAKVYLNDIDNTFRSSTKKASEMTQNFNHLMRFLSWMFQKKGVYRVSSLTRSDFDDFLTDFENFKGWIGLFDIEPELRVVIKSLDRGDINIKDVCSSWEESGNKYVKIRDKFFEETLGIPLNRNQAPEWFCAELLRFHGSEFSNNHRKSDGKAKDSLSYMEAYSVIKALNRLYKLPSEIDQAVVKPFPNAHKLAKKVAGNTVDSGRTLNLTLDDAIKLFKESLAWIYDYWPGVQAILQAYRQRLVELTCELEECSDKWLREQLSNDLTLKERVSELCLQYGLPFKGVVLDRRSQAYNEKDTPCVDELIRHTMTACFIMIATNHGRRLNEVIGQGTLPYGFYFGCIKIDGENPELRLCDIYVEKTVKDWCTFYVNKLVKDSVCLLEELSQIFRPLYANKKAYESDIETARKDKLFVFRALTPASFTKDPVSYSYNANSKGFLRRAGVKDVRFDHRSHPFRRFFALLYFYRYDNPKLLALQHQLRQFDPGMTVVYVTDPVLREDADKIEKIYRSRMEEHTKNEMEELEDVRGEAFLENVLQILKGERLGGHWPRIVLRLYRVLSQKVNFNEKDLTELAEIVGDNLLRRGYHRTAYEHGGCNNGDNDRTRRMSKCYREEDGFRHTEDASPSQCQSCIHHDSGETNICLLKEQVEELREQVEDYGTPLAVRHAAKDELQLLERVIEAEKKLADQNREFLRLLSSNFAQLASALDKE